MNRDEVQELLHQGRQAEIIQEFATLGYSVSRLAIAETITTEGYTVQEMYDLFLAVLMMTAPSDRAADPEPVDSEQANSEPIEQLRAYLTSVLPAEVVNQPDFLHQGIPAYLETWNNSPQEAQRKQTQLFDVLWDALKYIGCDDGAIGVAWRSVLHLSS